MSNRFIPKIQKNYKSISKYLIILALLTEQFLLQAPPINIFLTGKLLVPAYFILIIDFFSIVTPKKVVIPKKVLSNTKLLNLCFINNIKNACINTSQKKNCVVEKTYNENKNIPLTWLPTMQQIYIWSSSNLNRNFYDLPLFKEMISLSSISSHCVVKFATYHP